MTVLTENFVGNRKYRIPQALIETSENWVINGQEKRFSHHIGNIHLQPFDSRNSVTTSIESGISLVKGDKSLALEKKILADPTNTNVSLTNEFHFQALLEEIVWIEIQHDLKFLQKWQSANPIERASKNPYMKSKIASLYHRTFNDLATLGQKLVSPGTESEDTQTESFRWYISQNGDDFNLVILDQDNPQVYYMKNLIEENPQKMHEFMFQFHMLVSKLATLKQLRLHTIDPHEIIPPIYWLLLKHGSQKERIQLISKIKIISNLATKLQLQEDKLFKLDHDLHSQPHFRHNPFILDVALIEYLSYFSSIIPEQYQAEDLVWMKKAAIGETDELIQAAMKRTYSPHEKYEELNGLTRSEIIANTIVSNHPKLTDSKDIQNRWLRLQVLRILIHLSDNNVINLWKNHERKFLDDLLQNFSVEDLDHLSVYLEEFTQQKRRLKRDKEQKSIGTGGFEVTEVASANFQL